MGPPVKELLELEPRDRKAGRGRKEERERTGEVGHMATSGGSLQSSSGTRTILGEGKRAGSAAGARERGAVADRLMGVRKGRKPKKEGSVGGSESEGLEHGRTTDPRSSMMAMNQAREGRSVMGVEIGRKGLGCRTAT